MTEVDVTDNLDKSTWSDLHESPRTPTKDPLQGAVDRVIKNSASKYDAAEAQKKFFEDTVIPEQDFSFIVHSVDAGAKSTETALRLNTGKPELHYLFTFPKAVAEFAKVCTYGEKKYDRGNYLKGGKPLSEYADCLLRHLNAFLNGEDIDPESDCHHLGHVVWNALAICQFVLSGNCIDNRVHEDKYKKEKEMDDEYLTTTFGPEEWVRTSDSGSLG